MSSAGARPGVAGGAYPERDAPPASRLERSLGALSAALGSAISQRELEDVAEKVGKLAEPLRSRDDSGFTDAVASVRALLRRGEPDDALRLQAMALVVEAVRRRLGLELRPVQIMGGWVMARGMLAEMATGEGKTLTAVLPAATAALAGIPVHVLSANDYLVERDAEEMRPVYEALGLEVGFVTGAVSDPALRRAAYAKDVCYVTASQLGFDYLRDRLARRDFRDALSERLAGGEGSLLLRGLCFAIVDEADSVLIDEARTPLVLAAAGSTGDTEKIYRAAIDLARGLEAGRDFEIDAAARSISLTAAGERALGDRAGGLPGVLSGPRRRAEWTLRALDALHLQHRDIHYVVREGRVEILDGGTGRIAVGRAWSEGLHQLVELKEGCPVTAATEAVARMSYQHFFARFLRLAGTTGTAREVSSEIRTTYGLPTVSIPAHRPEQVRDLGFRVHADSEARWSDVVSCIRRERDAGRPVLVGTASVVASRRLSELLKEAGIDHQVLDAHHDAEEAQAVRAAGALGCVTVATRMAGRGTDIPLGPGVEDRGGLHVILAEHAESRRIDRQLRGRCGRQGAPGSFEVVLSVDEGPLARRTAAPLLRACEAALRGGGWRHRIATRLVETLTRRAQIAEERSARRARRALQLHEQALEELLVFSGGVR